MRTGCAELWACDEPFGKPILRGYAESMGDTNFSRAVERILERDARFSPEAYEFLREALDYTVKTRRRNATGMDRHVSAVELCMGFRDLALERFGPMAIYVLNTWGIHSTSDIGDMVYNLIAEDVFRASPTDRPEDFDNVYDLDIALRLPFVARNRVNRRRWKIQPAPPLRDEKEP